MTTLFCVGIFTPAMRATPRTPSCYEMPSGLHARFKTATH
jgi:hypothetical protein